jgi:hypothetical protein
MPGVLAARKRIPLALSQSYVHNTTTQADSVSVKPNSIHKWSCVHLSMLLMLQRNADAADAAASWWSWQLLLSTIYCTYMCNIQHQHNAGAAGAQNSAVLHIQCSMLQPIGQAGNLIIVAAGCWCCWLGTDLRVLCGA